MWRPYLNFLASLKFDYKSTIAMTAGCVWIDHWSELQRSMNLPLAMMLTPNLIASYGRVMRDLFKCYLIFSHPSLIGLSEDWIKRLSHLHCKLSEADSITYYELKTFQSIFW